MPTRKELAQSILNGHDPEEVVAATIFDVDDVLSLAFQLDEENPVCEEMAKDILDYVHNNQDASVGVNWDVIQDALELFRNPSEIFRNQEQNHFHNYYRCICGNEWDDYWTCTSNDKCPNCNKEIEPYISEEVR